MVRENGCHHKMELCQVDSNPQKVAEAVAMKLLRPGRQYRIRKYNWIRIVDNGDAQNVPHISAGEPPAMPAYCQKERST